MHALAAFDMARIQRWVTEAAEPERTILTPSPSSVPAAAGAALSLIVLRLARRGLEMVEQALVEPLRGLYLEPVTAVTRGTPATPDEHALTFRLEAGEMNVHVAAAAREDALALTLTFRGTEQQALTGARITVRQKGRMVLSAKTDERGQLQAPHLDPGVYEVECREPQVAFRLEVRGESGEPAATVMTKEPRG
jgi:hypothetical protein